MDSPCFQHFLYIGNFSKLLLVSASEFCQQITFLCLSNVGETRYLIVGWLVTNRQKKSRKAKKIVGINNGILVIDALEIHYKENCNTTFDNFSLLN